LIRSTPYCDTKWPVQLLDNPCAASILDKDPLQFAKRRMSLPGTTRPVPHVLRPPELRNLELGRAIINAVDAGHRKSVKPRFNLLLCRFRSKRRLRSLFGIIEHFETASQLPLRSVLILTHATIPTQGLRVSHLDSISLWISSPALRSNEKERFPVPSLVDNISPFLTFLSLTLPHSQLRRQSLPWLRIPTYTYRFRPT
jgi:hypothetical protein